MKFEDIIALAKAGYSVADVKELLTMQPSADSEPQDPTPKETTPQPVENTPKESAQQTVATVEEVADDNAGAVDYKKLYEEAQEKLEKAQKDNLRKNIKPEEKGTIEDTLADIVRGFM